MAQADVMLPEYVDESGFTCSAILITDDFLKMADGVRYAEAKTIYQERLKKVLELIDSSKAEIAQIEKADILEKAAEELNNLMGLFAIKDDQLLQDIYLNVQMRATLMGNSTAIYEIINLSIPIREESLKKNFTLNGAHISKDQFLSIPQKISEKCEELSKVNPLREVLAEL